jgi:peroxiredoxin
MKPLAIFLIAALSLFAAGEYSNRRAPGFSLQDPHFEQHDPEDYRGKVLIVEFMQTTCPVCQRLTDTLLQIKEKYGDRIAVLSIVTLPDNFQTVEKFAADRKIPWPMLFDSGQVMMSYLKVTPSNPKVEFPHVFLIDGKGTIRNDFGAAEAAALTIRGLSTEIDRLL